MPLTTHSGGGRSGHHSSEGPVSPARWEPSGEPSWGDAGPIEALDTWQLPGIYLQWPTLTDWQDLVRIEGSGHHGPNGVIWPVASAAGRERAASRRSPGWAGYVLAPRRT